MYDIAMLTQNDWANTGYRFKKCLEYLGYNIIGFKGFPHQLNYPEQLSIHMSLSMTRPVSAAPIIIKTKDLRPLVDNSEVVHFVASTIIDTMADLTRHKVVSQHGGTTYRMNTDTCNNIFNKFTDYTIMQFPTLLGHGANNEHLIYYPVDTNFIRPRFNRIHKDKLVIGHFPSSWESKGTDVIINVINRLKYSDKIGDRFEYIGLNTLVESRTEWLYNLDRMSRCDILIETIKPELTGKPFCEWGNTALEGCALGKIVITNTDSLDLYEKEYGGRPELVIANNAAQLESQLTELLISSDKIIEEKKHAARKWVETKHSIPATAERLYDKIYKHLLPNRRDAK